MNRSTHIGINISLLAISNAIAGITIILQSTSTLTPRGKELLRDNNEVYSYHCKAQISKEEVDKEMLLLVCSFLFLTIIAMAINDGTITTGMLTETTNSIV